MRFLLDQNLDDELERVLTASGNEVGRIRDELGGDAADDVIALHSVFLSAVLISHDGDFQSIGPRVSLGRLRFRKLSRIWLRCRERHAPRRIEAALPFIAFEWVHAKAQRDTRMILEIGESYMRTNR